MFCNLTLINMLFLAIWLSCTLSITNAFFDGDVSTYELLYGDLTNLENSFALPFNMSINDLPGPELKPVKRRVLSELLEKLEKVNTILDSHEGRFDIDDFNAINTELKNLTRNQIKQGYRRYYYDVDDYYTSGIHERKKKMMFLMVNLQFLIHTRYKVAVAINLRNVVKHDKRYKLGYLFARMRRLLVTQRKMTATAENNRLYWYTHNLYTLMRLYEKSTRLDVDMRDTSALIKRIYGTSAIIDKLY